MLIVIDKSTHEKIFSQSLQTDNKQFKSAVTFLTAYNGIFNITTENNKFYSTTSSNDDDFNVRCILPGAYELESLNEKNN